MKTKLLTNRNADAHIRQFTHLRKGHVDVGIRAPMVISAFAALLLSLLLGGCSKSPNLIGAWQGTLDLKGTQLRIIFKVARGPDGALIGTLDSPDQGAKDIAMTIEATKAPAVLFKVPTIGGSYEGKIESGGAKMSGQWKQGMVSLPLQVERIDAAKAAQATSRKANPESVEANKKTGGKLVGQWEGTLIAGARLRLLFKIAESPEGGLLGSLDSLDQGAHDIPITAISYDEPDIIFEVKTIGGEFAGSLTNAQLTGSWQQAGQSFFLALSKKE